MQLYGIGDLHLSLGVPEKPMDIFHGWENYMQLLEQHWRAMVQPEDTVVLAGDLSWGMTLPQAKADFAFLETLPGQKIILKGNHDYWWNSMKKMQQFFADNGFDSLHILHNNHYALKEQLTPIVFLHYPPIYGNSYNYEILEVLHRYAITECYYGHIHGKAHQYAFEGVYEETKMHLISGDYIQFKPVKIV